MTDSQALGTARDTPRPSSRNGLVWLTESVWKGPAPAIAAVSAFLILFWEPLITLGQNWWHNPDASHGLLLGPLAIFLAWRRGTVPKAEPHPTLGIVLLLGAVTLRFLSGLAAELYVMRLSMFGALLALIVFAMGTRQLLHWWLPTALLLLSVPLPTVLLNSLALPLQLKASAMGAQLLEWRHVPSGLAGNVILLPGQSLFVTEACSGLRSITALLSLGVLIGGIWLRTPWTRALLIVATIPVAMILNGFRVFLTGFLVYNVDRRAGDGFLHYTQGWGVFVVAFAVVAALAWLFARTENVLTQMRAA